MEYKDFHNSSQLSILLLQEEIEDLKKENERLKTKLHEIPHEVPFIKEQYCPASEDQTTLWLLLIPILVIGVFGLTYLIGNLIRCLV